MKIKARQASSTNWTTNLVDIKLPCKVVFAVFSDYTQIKKIIWDWGDGTKHQVSTNKKGCIEGQEYSHIYRPKNVIDCNTISVGSTAYTDTDEAVVLNTITLEEVSHKDSHIYVDPEKFKQNIVQYYKDDNFTDELGESIYLICSRLAYAPNFVNYTYREEMVGDALIKMVEALKGKKFDPDKGNPFSYFTKIAFHAFCNRIKKEKRAREALAEYQNNVFEELVADGLLPCTSNMRRLDDDE